MPLTDLISNEILLLKKNGFYRTIPEIDHTRKNFITISGHKLINLSTNDYLGLSFNKTVIKAAKDAISAYSASSSSSPLICGHTKLHADLEKNLCEFKGSYEKCILYPSGYQANAGIITAVANISPLKTFIFFDEFSHASIIDGVRASNVKFTRFKHNNAARLKNLLEKYSSFENKIIITEGVFSMDGDIADLANIAAISKDHGAIMIVDDAHATGTIGIHGGGSPEFHHIKPDILVGTLGKALASSGAFALANSLIIDFLINKSRQFIFSTTMPPSSAAAALASLRIIEKGPAVVAKLQEKSKFARNYLKNSGLNTLTSSTHIIPILVGNEIKALDFEKKLLKNGVFLKAIRYPAVPKNEARLRISITAELPYPLLERALEKIVAVCKG